MKKILIHAALLAACMAEAASARPSTTHARRNGAHKAPSTPKLASATHNRYHSGINGTDHRPSSLGL